MGGFAPFESSDRESTLIALHSFLLLNPHIPLNIIMRLGTLFNTTVLGFRVYLNSSQFFNRLFSTVQGRASDSFQPFMFRNPIATRKVLRHDRSGIVLSGNYL